MYRIEAMQQHSRRADYMKENPIFSIREPSFAIYAGAN